MAFSPNRAVNRVNLHYGLQSFAEACGGVFILAFVLRAGLSVPMTLVAFAGMLAGRFVLRPLVLPFARRFGLKSALILGTLANAVTYPMLSAVHGLGAPLALFTVTASFAGAFYWTSFHAYFAAVGDAENRGHQIGTREILASVLGIAAPLAGGAALTAFGPGPMFAGVGIVQALAVLPLLQAPAIAIAPPMPGTFRADRTGAWLFLADGGFTSAYHYVWQIALFVTLGENFQVFGGALALAALVGAGCGLVLGRRIDAGHGRSVAILAYGVAAGVVVLRAASGGSPWLAVIGNTAGAFAGALLMPTMMTAVYNLAKAAPCPLRFHVVAEGAWDIGCGAIALASAALIAAGLPLSLAVLLALPGAAGAAALLWRRYSTVRAAGMT